MAHVSQKANESNFKNRRTFDQRQRESRRIQELHPIKIPVIIERYKGEKMLPLLERAKFLLPSHTEVAELIQILRRRLELHRTQAFFILVNGRNMFGNSLTMREVYEKERDDDGFLYISFASHEVFGEDTKCNLNLLLL